ncbi:L-serine ammonia-lyase, iron-sulfur-dependent, subunit alpha [Peloplasma aerotolerans]|uniref:L-serine ammonia-lyase, iron-sulfur-dependent, subunit alpha n=1 Tax=Peloplasma aerotolerans TaxID=3044389 RepID=A0AAW6U5J2_9MOLU|nr:L-serine ammonia-lyase, iron-sulfur-dependent, subunit alpha [Mariniplasma sp. M4Ah]MDI6453187.1 L-serine ammonia-lyase, iron-sulfur-dependent, subunit alpha [Mariniplasma sp. M4Ah]MDR4968570.1 L-serine ammonia-lyase, iron-sulfur-dependent, subunit alpha [Acholeplasmataceae bacterium]
MNQVTAKKILESNIARTIGCTDIGVVGYIASIGAYILRNQKIHSIHLTMSDELYKNSVNVGVPGLRKSGLNQALALGVLLKNPKEQLSVFESVTNNDIEQIESLLKEISVKIEHHKYDDTVLYEELLMTSTDGDEVKIVIKDHYDNVVSVVKNGEKMPEFERKALIDRVNQNKILSYDEIFDFVEKNDFTGLEELFRIATIQYENSSEEMKKIGRNYLVENLTDSQKSCTNEISNFLKEHIEVSSKKRMIGDIFTVYGVAGSGNLGIGTLVTPMFLSDAYNLSQKKREQLIVLSFYTSVYVKQEMNIVTVLCGTGHATGCSSAASFVFSKEGTRKQIKDAINLYLSTSMGFVCDGAKVSCTYKVSFAAMNGMITGHMVMDQSISCDGFGLNKTNVDETIKNLGRLNNEILNTANKGIISLI